ncbi:MAG: chemotaxis protein MotB [Bdellovibrionales bacterium]|nr:chemotaxis protein MotB [Bdellovibrionales bacterium]
MIVIKKITNVQAGGHGGAWKVAFADFMTALMAFFLVMWLVAQSEEVKKNVADYFSTPSIIEYNFSNYGVELTLEKLFLDLMNEPLKFFQTFITPVDYTPNIMNMGSKKVVMHHIADQLGDIAGNVQVEGNTVAFDLPATALFLPGSARTNSSYVEVMDKVKNLVAGVEDSNVYVDSIIFDQSVKGNDINRARQVAEERLDLISKKIEVSIEQENVDVYGKTSADLFQRRADRTWKPDGVIRVRIEQKDLTKDGKKPRELEDLFGKANENMDIYNDFVNRLTNRKTGKK